MEYCPPSFDIVLSSLDKFMSLLLALQINQRRDKGSRRAKPALPPEYRWPQPTPEQPHPLADVVVQAQIQGVVLPKNLVLAIALRKATEIIVRPIRQKVEKAITDDEDEDDLFFFT